MKFPVRRGGLSALAECPEIAPYINEYGNCTNVPPAPAGAAFVQTPYTDPQALPPGYFMNPVTGQVVDLSQVQQASMYAPGLAPNQNAGFQEAVAAEAEAIAAARGLDAECSVRANSGPSGTLYFTECCLNNVCGFGGEELIRPGGFEIAANEISYMTGQPTPMLQPDPYAVPYVDVYNSPENQLQFQQPLSIIEEPEEQYQAAAVSPPPQTVIYTPPPPTSTQKPSTPPPTSTPPPPPQVQTVYVPQAPVYITSPGGGQTISVPRPSQLDIIGAAAKNILPASAAPQDIKDWADKIPVWAWVAAAAAAYYLTTRRKR
jgi:hypothetical protein